MFKMDLSKFKKIASDKDSTTMRHEDGHVMKIAHKPLNPKIKEQLKSLPAYSDGGDVDKPAPNPTPTPDQDEQDPKAKFFKDFSKKVGMDKKAKGGEIKGQPNNPKLAESKKQPPKMAEGGDVADKQQPSAEEDAVESYNPIDTLKDAAHYVAAKMVNQMAQDTDEFNAAKEASQAGDRAPMQAYLSKHAAQMAMGTMTPVGPRQLPFHMQAAVNKTEQDAARQAAGKLNASEANALDRGIITGAERNQKIEAYQANKPKKMAEGGEANASTMPKPVPDDLSDLPVRTPGEQLVEDKMDLLRNEQPGTYLSFPDRLRDDAQNLVLREQQAQKTAEDTATADSVRKSQERIQQVQAYNANAQKFGLPLKPLSDSMESQQAADANTPPIPAIGTDQNSMQPPTPPMQSAAAQPDQNDAGMPNLENAYKQGMAGISQEAAARGALGNEQADILQRAAQQKEAQIQLYAQNYKALEDERQAHMQDIMNNRIDPDKYWENHSKLSAAIGLLIGGWGAGHSSAAAGTAVPNQAAEMLQRNIDRSIQAQAHNLNSAHNLLNANMQQFGNLRDATTMTRIMMNDVTTNYLDKAAAQSQDPIAKARAMQLKSQLQRQMIPEFNQLAMRRAIIQASTPQGGSQAPASSAENMLPYLRVLNPESAKEMESRLIPGVGMATIPVPDKVRDELSGRASLQDQVHNLRMWSRQHSGDLNPADRAYGQALASSVQDAYRRANGQGVFREAEANFVKGIVADDPTTFFNKYRTDPKYKALEDSNNMALNGLKKSYGLPQQDQAARLTPQQQSFVKWARENPSDPRAPILLQKLGLQ